MNREEAKGLNANQLKLIAIIAMTIDHIAWGFVDMFSIPGQTMHVIGRLTLPIMCFFIAEGYRKTSDIRRYVRRMATFATISFIPFWLFFGEEYGKRQNIIFDLMLALIALWIVDSHKLKKWQKVVLFILVTTLSAIIAGWPVFPILLVLIFYYVKSPRKQFALVFGSVCLVELTVFTVIYLNSIYHLWSYNWKWYEYLYFFGFALAVPLLTLYNGEKGSDRLGRYFFYLYYPVHFFLLFAIKMYVQGNYYRLYFNIHVMCLLAAICITILVVKQTPSYASQACLVLGTSAAIYTFGFILEIFTDDVSFAFVGVILEYFGECIVFISFLWFISIFCKRRIPRWVYGIAGIFSAFIVFSIVTTRTSKLFYTDMHMDYSGPFPRIQLYYGAGYYVFVFYMVAMCGSSIVLCLQSLIRATGIEKRRIANVMAAITCPWIAFLLWGSGLTGGYEVSVIGVLGALYLIYRAIVQYGYFDSMQLAQANALYHFREGILVADFNNRVTYVNDSFKEQIAVIKGKTVTDPVLLKMLDGSLTKLEKGKHIFDVERIPLTEKGFNQGVMIYLHDMTDHYLRLEEAEHFAHTDGLTGLSNRNYFKDCYISFRESGGVGSLLMFDLDNFKGVNDRLGHDAGDIVLITLAETLEAASSGRHLTCRIGGDEYVMFLKNITDKTEVAQICRGLISDFSKRLADKGLEGITSISIGVNIIAQVTEKSDEKEFTTQYKLADGALYKAKTGGKATFCMADDVI